jgi:hypothetical protein
MTRFRVTIERASGTWGQVTLDAPDMATALRMIPDLFVLTGARNVHVVAVDPAT